MTGTTVDTQRALTGAEVVARALTRLGATHCFGVVGSGNFDVTNFLIAHGLEFIAARHEGGAVAMADAHARMNGAPALVSVHQGCGLTNTATGLGEAAKSRTPLVVLTAESSQGDVHSNFAIDQDAFALSVGASAHRLHRAETVLTDVLRAWRAAVIDRRSVVLSMPLNVQSAASAEAVEVDDAVDHLLGQLGPTLTVPADIDAVVEDLACAERPVFIVGRGGRKAGEAIAELGWRTGALLATSAVAKGLFNRAKHEGSEFNLGISGGFSSPSTAELIRGADLIVSFGCALNDWTTRRGRLLHSRARIVQVDIAPDAPGQHRDIDRALIGDAAATARTVSQAWQHRFGPEPRLGYRTEEVRAEIAVGDWRLQPVKQEDMKGPGVDPRMLTSRLDELLPDERIVSIDSGNFMGYPAQFLGVPDENGF